MSGYAGNSDLGAEQANIFVENAIFASSELLVGPSYENCADCGEDIGEDRIQALKKLNMKCVYCIQCQNMFDKPRQIKMLTHLL